MQTRLYPYFAFKNAKAAIDYYERVFGATDIDRLSPKPEQAKQFGLPEDADLESMTMHAGFTVLGNRFECADDFTGGAEASRQISLMLDVNSEDAESMMAADTFYQQIVASKEVEITMPYETQFWGGKMGHFVDKYGVNWMLHSSPWSQAKDQ